MTGRESKGEGMSQKEFFAPVPYQKKISELISQF